MPGDEEAGGFQDSPQGLADMEAHYFEMINPERFQTTVPKEPGYKAGQIKKAERFLISEGYKIIR